MAKTGPKDWTARASDPTLVAKVCEALDAGVDTAADVYRRFNPSTAPSSASSEGSPNAIDGVCASSEWVDSWATSTPSGRPTDESRC